MKKVAFYNYYEILNTNNNMFENVGSPTIKDFLYQMSEMKKYAQSQDILVGSVNIFDLDEVDGFVFIDMPNLKNKYLQYAIKSKKPMYLIVWESKVVNNNNYLPENWELFHKIFTYDDSLVDNKKFIKLAYSFNFPEEVPRNFRDRKLCTIIAGNKHCEHPLELYSYRRQIIRWFERNHIEDFDLYGKDWDKHVFKGSLIKRALNKIQILKKIVGPQYPSYRGEVDSKDEVFKRYKFSICFENAKDIPGYITEKIFDCFFSGCIPIYLGADNIDSFIPKNCFIDERDFRSIEEIYYYINSIDEKRYNQYIDNIEKFIISDKSEIFKTDYFSKTLINNISMDLTGGKNE